MAKNETGLDNDEVKEVLSHLKGDDFKVESVERKEHRRNAPLISSMQQDKLIRSISDS